MPPTLSGKSIRAVVYTARENRKAMTTAEQVLWEALRRRSLAGLRFRKQHPIQSYILDFYCVEQRLAIEVDGAIHLQPERQTLDQERTLFLQEAGVRVLRFTNTMVLENIEQVLKDILRFIEQNPV